MFGRTLGFAHWAIVPLVALATAASAQTPAYIAGVQPDSRPAAAPRIERFEKPAGWLDRSTRGVEKPRPDSLKFLDDQGAWYTPFTRPGMTGPYDIRHFHRSGKAGHGKAPAKAARARVTHGTGFISGSSLLVPTRWSEAMSKHLVNTQRREL